MYAYFKRERGIILGLNQGAAEKRLPEFGQQVRWSSIEMTAATTPADYGKSLTISRSFGILSLPFRMRLWSPTSYKFLPCVFEEPMNPLRRRACWNGLHLCVSLFHNQRDQKLLWTLGCSPASCRERFEESGGGVRRVLGRRDGSRKFYRSPSTRARSCRDLAYCIQFGLILVIEIFATVIRH